MNYQAVPVVFWAVPFREFLPFTRLARPGGRNLRSGHAEVMTLPCVNWYRAECASSIVL